MLAPVRLPGGERAIKQPWRMACSWLSAAQEREPDIPVALRGSVDARAWGNVCRLVRAGVGSPLTTSMGRLFDAVAALSGVRAEVNYEGQGAIELEAACDPGERGRYPIALSASADILEIDPVETIRSVAADAAAGVSAGVIASRFHAAISWATVEACAKAASTHGTEIVALGGGVFQNRRLLESVARGLHAAGLRVLVPERLPINDGGIAYGQAAVAAARLRS
jgi:hydrogenase maturation protein HypF